MKIDDWMEFPKHFWHHPTEAEILWRMKGFLDCLKHQKVYGPVDPKYIEYLVEKTGEKAP